MFFDVKNLCYSFYRKPLCLKDINFSLEENSKVLLLASKEMGKTAFLSVVSGFEKSYFGNILKNGKELKKLEASEINVSFLPENPVFFKNKSIFENFVFTNNVVSDSNLTIEQANEICKDFEINLNLKTKIKKLSVAEKRILAIARTKLKNCEIIFVDDQLTSIKDEEKRLVLKAYERLLNNNNSVFIAMGDDNYKKCKDFIKNAKFDKIFYLCDAKLRIFKNIEEFENKALTYDMLKFLEQKYFENKCVVERQDKFYNIYFGDKFFSLDSSFNKYLDKLKLDLEDTEYAIICTKEELDITSIKEDNLNNILKSGNALLFSSLSGERLI